MLFVHVSTRCINIQCKVMCSCFITIIRAPLVKSSLTVFLSQELSRYDRLLLRFTCATFYL